MLVQLRLAGEIVFHILPLLEKCLTWYLGVVLGRLMVFRAALACVIHLLKIFLGFSFLAVLSIGFGFGFMAVLQHLRFAGEIVIHIIPLFEKCLAWYLGVVLGRLMVFRAALACVIHLLKIFLGFSFLAVLC